MALIKRNEMTTWLINKLKEDKLQYPPLNKEAEQQLIAKYRNNRPRLNELLYLHNIRLVFSMSKRYVSKTKDFDSLISDGLYGLSIACDRFDIDRGIKFSTFATPWIFKYCLMDYYSRHTEMANNSISLDTIVSRDNFNGGDSSTSFENFIATKIDKSCENDSSVSIDTELSSMEYTDICKKMFKLMNKDTSLSATDKEIFIEHVYNKGSSKDIAKKFNISVQNVNKIKNKVLGKLRTILATNFNVSQMSDITL